MAASSNNMPAIQPDNVLGYPVKAATHIYEGSLVGDDGSGYARGLVAGDPFRGMAYDEADNTSGAAADKYVRVRARCRVKVSLSAAAITDVGKDVFASDSNTYTLTQSTNTRVGVIVGWVSTGVVIVELQPQSGTVVELTDSSTGTASDTLAAMTGVDGTGSNAAPLTATKNAIASIAAKVNEVVRRYGG